MDVFSSVMQTFTPSCRQIFPFNGLPLFVSLCVSVLDAGSVSVDASSETRVRR